MESNPGFKQEDSWGSIPITMVVIMKTKKLKDGI